MKIKLNTAKKYLIPAILIILGILLIIFPEDKKTKTNENQPDTTIVLEQRISEMIRKTYNLEEVSVILTYDTYNNSKSSDNLYDYNVLSNNKQSVNIEKLPYVRGALIAVKNIDQKTSEEIKNAVSVLLGVSTHKVTVIYN